MKKKISFQIKIHPSKMSMYCVKVICENNKTVEFFPSLYKYSVINWAMEYYTTMGLHEPFSEYRFII